MFVELNLEAVEEEAVARIISKEIEITKLE